MFASSRHNHLLKPVNGMSGFSVNEVFPLLEFSLSFLRDPWKCPNYHPSSLFSRAPGLLSRNFFIHVIMNSLICPLSLHRNMISLDSLSLWRLFLFKKKMVSVSSNPPELMHQSYFQFFISHCFVKYWCRSLYNFYDGQHINIGRVSSVLPICPMR